MRVLYLFCLCLIAILFVGCDTDRINRLEKENQELKTKVEKGDAARDYDLGARCSKDAKQWFRENYSRDKDTELLDYTNHYKKASNKCFLVVEFHYKTGASWTWINDITLWDLYENSKYGHFAEEHIIEIGSKTPPTNQVISCEVLGNKCTSMDEFHKLADPYMSN